MSFEQHGRFEHREHFEQEQENSTKLLSFVYRGIVGILNIAIMLNILPFEHCDPLEHLEHYGHFEHFTV